MFYDNSAWDWFWILYAVNVLIVQPAITICLAILGWRLLSKRSDNQG